MESFLGEQNTSNGELLKMELKIVALAVLLTFTTTSASPLINQRISTYSENVADYRLPTSVEPLHYIIKLEPLLGENEPTTFKGSVEILVRISEETDNITLHYYDMKITSFEVKKEGNDTPISVYEDYDIDTHFYTLYVNDSTQKLEINETYIITLKYEGNHRDDMYGFYRSYYKTESGDKVWLATTQFQPTHARRAFPCFDEPALKATFDIRIKRTSTRRAISNMPRIEDNDPTWDKFEETKNMSSYLIAFVVSDFAYAENTARNFKIWARKDAIKEGQAKYSLDVGPPILHAMEEFLLGEKYQLPKMDEVAVPDFSAGAMENWGLVTYRERLILHSSSFTNAESKQRIATVIAHEFAHQWFGDLVSPEWWNYLWLNEGFATYFESFATAMVEKDWRMREQFVVRDVHSSLAFDGLATSHPMTQPVGSPNSIRSIFDSISYEKAGSVIRMMEHFLTDIIFKRGLQAYLTERQYDYANEDHLYTAMDNEFRATESILYRNVAEVMHTWTRQAGFPLLTVTSDANNLILKQERFFLQQSEGADKSKWIIPLTYTVQDGSFTDTSPKQWMTDYSMKIERPTTGDKWYIFNVQEVGFYRVNYDEDNWNKLIDYLHSDNYEKIHPVNRAQLLDDALTLARAGGLEYETALRLTQYLKKESDYIPWYSALNALSFLNLRLSGDDSYPKFKDFVLDLISKIYHELEFEEWDTDSHVKKLHRGLILQWACDLDQDHCIATARQKFSAIESGGATIPADLQSVVYCTAVRKGGKSEWQRLWKKYVNSNHATEQTLILSALGCTIEEDLINEYLTMSIDPNSEIRRQDAASVFSSVYSNANGFKLALNFLQKNYDSIQTFYGTGVSSIVTGIASRITTKEQLDEFEAFVKDSDLGAANDAAERAIESATENLKWMDNYGPKIRKWLESISSKATSLSFSYVLCIASVISATYSQIRC